MPLDFLWRNRPAATVQARLDHRQSIAPRLTLPWVHVLTLNVRSTLLGGRRWRRHSQSRPVLNARQATFAAGAESDAILATIPLQKTRHGWLLREKRSKRRTLPNGGGGKGPTKRCRAAGGGAIKGRRSSRIWIDHLLAMRSAFGLYLWRELSV